MTISYVFGRVSAVALSICLPVSLMAQESGPIEVEAEEEHQKSEPETAEELPADEKSLEDGGRLDLICGGEGTANKPTVLTGNSNSTYSGSGGFVSGSSNATIYGMRQQGFGDQVALFIEAGEGRIRMPRAMLPPLRGGEDGWFKLGGIKITDQEITATVRVNFMNKPKLRVDRYTGAISISGKAGDYSGRCQRFEPEETEQQF